MTARVTIDTMVPAPGDRAMLVGQTGSGKTTLAHELLRSRTHVVVLDGKGQLRWPEYTVYRTLDRLAKAKEPKLIYRPVWADLQDWDEQEAFFAWVFQRRNCTVYVDELFLSSKGDVFPRHLGACLMQGRELHVEFWSATQRPHRVPQVAMSEAEHFFAFKLKLPQDRDRVQDITGISGAAIHALPKREFLYARQDEDTAGPYSLNLKKSRAVVVSSTA